MKESLSVLAQAEVVVNTAEASYVNGLFVWEANAKHRSENCKCPQCQHEVKRASVAIAREIARITPEEEIYERT